MLKFGGDVALTKHLQDDILRPSMTIEDLKLEVMPKIIDNTQIINNAPTITKPRTKTRNKTPKSQMPPKKTRLEKVTAHLYNLEEAHCPEQCLNLDLDLYQMEDY